MCGKRIICLCTRRSERLRMQSLEYAFLAVTLWYVSKSGELLEYAS